MRAHFALSSRGSQDDFHLSLVMRKLAFCICENKDADQLRGNREVDQRLCFRYRDSTIPPLPKSEFQASSHLLWLYSSVCVGPCRKHRRPVISERGSFVRRRKIIILKFCLISSVFQNMKYERTKTYYEHHQSKNGFKILLEKYAY